MPENLAATYKEIAGYIMAKEGKCVLILGPELSVDKTGTGYKAYFRKMAAEKDSGIFSYFEEDNLFSFNNEAALKDNRRLIRNFYKDSGDPVLLEMIARIRFPLIINLCPDISLNNLYDKYTFTYKAGYFSRDSKPKFKDLPYPTKELPVIYNIFGCVEPDTSLILEHSKLYETIQYLLPDNSLPENIETFLKEASSFILLGMKFDSWYYQLICHKLKLKEYDKNKTNLSASNSNDTDSVSVVMRKQFEIDFTPDNPMQAMEKLIRECNNSKDAIRDIESPGTCSLFVSYAWNDKDAPPGVSRETMVDWAEKYSALKDVTGLHFFRDHKDLGFGDSIDSFMTRIGKGKMVIRVISDKYLKSRYCMTEALRMDTYKDEEKRIITVIWEDADLGHEITYRDYWKEKCKSILEDLEKKLDNDDYDYATRIYRFLPSFINGLKDEIGLRVGKNDFIIDPQTGEIKIIDARKEELKQFIDAIISKIKDN